MRVGGAILMADHERQQRQRLLALQNNHQLARRFTVQGRATGKQLGTGSYGSVEEVRVCIYLDPPPSGYYLCFDI